MTACADTLRVELHYGQWEWDHAVPPAFTEATEHADVLWTSGGRVKALGGNDFIVDADAFWAEFNVALRVAAEEPAVYGEGGGNGRLSGGAGDDVIMAGDGHDTVFAGTGDDIVLGDAVEITDAEGQDRASIRQVRETRAGNAGNDQLYGGPGNDIIHGGAGDDHVQGGPGNDILLGGPGADTLVPRGGEPQADLPGGGNWNFIWGGPGADVFDLRDAVGVRNFIMDFDPAEGDRALLPEGTGWTRLPLRAPAWMETMNLQDYDHCAEQVVDLETGSVVGNQDLYFGAFLMDAPLAELNQWWADGDVFIA